MIMALNRRINAEGIALIKQWEGLKLDAYKDIGGVWTIGYGHTRTAKPNMRITETEAETLLRQDLYTFEMAVIACVHVHLTDNQFAALVSWAYNVGAEAMRKSTLIRKLNDGDYASVPAELAKWTKVKGKTVRGLANRRAAEAGLWARGDYVVSRDTTPDDGLTAAQAATQTGTGRAAMTVGAAGVAATVAQHSDLLVALGALGPIVGVALIVVAAGLFVLWRKGKI